MDIDIEKYLRVTRTRFNRHAEAANEIERLRAALYCAESDRDYYHERFDQNQKCLDFIYKKKAWWKR